MELKVLFHTSNFQTFIVGGLAVCLIVVSFCQSAALPPLAVPAQTWKPTTAKMNLWLTSTAAAASAQIHLGSALLVFSTQQLELDSGSQSHSVLQKAVAVKVSGGCSWTQYIKNSVPQVL